MIRFTLSLIAVLTLCQTSFAEEQRFNAPLTRRAGPIVIKVVMVEDGNEDPQAAGKAAAVALKKAMGDVPLKAVVVSECFEDQPFKQKLLDGLKAELDENIIFGGATYGSFTQQGCTDFDAVCLMGIGGTGVGVSASLQTDLGTSKLVFEEHQAEIEKKLRTAGAQLVGKIQRTVLDKLLIITADAHSPKNQYLVEGAQLAVGKTFPITGGSANKNEGQTFVYFQGKMYKDSAVAMMLSGNFKVSMAGREAKDNDAVIKTAKEGAKEAIDGAEGKPIAVLAYNCAGRRGKLKRMEDELTAIQSSIGKKVPLFGCYNAGEIGPLDTSEKKPGVLCGGGGWHVMFTVIER